MRTKDRSIGYAWRLDSRFLLRLVRLLACTARWTEDMTTPKYIRASVCVVCMKSCKKREGRERERIFQSPLLYPQFSHDRLSPPIGGGEPAVSRPSVAPLISVTVFGTTWGYFYSRLPRLPFPSLPFFHFVSR
jgi:hypothetical protein